MRLVILAVFLSIQRVINSATGANEEGLDTTDLSLNSSHCAINRSDKFPLTPTSYPTCSLYLAQSNIPNAGRGVFAGKYFDINDLVELGPTLLIRGDDCAGTQLEDYIFGSDHDDYSMVVFGPPSLFNSHNNKSLYYNWQPSPAGVTISASDSILNHSIPYTTYTATVFYALRVIEDGEELLSNYGDGWFEARERSEGSGDVETDMSESTCANVDSADCNLQNSHFDSQTNASNEQSVNVVDDEVRPQSQRICLTDIEVMPSTIPGAGLGIVATRDFTKGELVTVSPVLTLPRAMVDQTAMTSLLVNYCIADADGESSIVLFPISKAALINHRLSPYDNVEMKWFLWDQQLHNMTVTEAQDEMKHYFMEPDKLMASPVAPLDIAFYAKRDICKGEELFLNYGESWQDDWQDWTMNQECSASSSSTVHNCQNNGLPFRHYISAPVGMFPDIWKIYESSTP